VDTDTGAVDPAAIAADSTVTFIAPKRGLVLYPGAGMAGQIVVDDLGVIPSPAELSGAPEVWERGDVARLIPVPATDAHKNSRGKLLIIGGSRRFPGAAVLAARGAMRAGAGYITLAVPEPIVSVVQAHLQATPVVGLPAESDGGFSARAVFEALDLADGFDAVVLGPGLTMADDAARFACEAYASIREPLVVDADALNALAELEGSAHRRGAPTVLTPHPGELARLLRTSVGDVQSDRVSSSAKLAGPDRVVVLKGAGTVVSGSGRQAVVTSGTPALATAGTGDVLAGLVGALLAQGLQPFDAAVVGAHLHGAAGELAAADLTPVCVNAEDLPDYLPGAVASVLEW
jgi:NAD(P)H-hydrate epimerase